MTGDINKRDRGRPKGNKVAMKTYGIRFDEDMINQVDRIVEAMREQTGFSLDRSDIIRQAVKEYLERKGHE
jgi:metal-responsive CopG/Arc/MetJ family transcriptional regulator